MASGRDDGGGSRAQDRSRPHLPQGGVGSVSGCGLNLRPTSGRLVRPPPLHTAETGRDPWIRRAVTGELPGPHANSVRYWSSPPLIRGLARALKANGGLPASRGALVVRAPRKGPAGTTPGLRQHWSPRLSRPDVCEGTLSVSVSVSSTSEMLYRSQWSRSGLSECIHVAVVGHHLMPV